ncbi:hypothetical protein PVBG_06026 [Plasmodium vivax Brazil I]|uniref:Uncharacterized protein n=1 Tax=Plasmodium vivax (strain Brazil I) TaxID=1033975 RepID=A0A0J9SJJ1_PLAV1|nr:hypothetical protein PVBG_06026 [Plasmodium vivax Brazil I]
MHVINPKNVIKLNTLYQLYKNYDTLKQKNAPYYATFLTTMRTEYNIALEKCFYDRDFIFCKALEKFKNSYETSKSNVSQYCIARSCPDLPELILSSEFHNESLRTSKIDNDLIWTSYAQYLRGHSADTSEKYYNLKKLISLQYNLLMEKDDDEKYCVMMKILHDFFQYCKKNIRNSHLLFFIKEFIEEYYKKKKVVYEKIFEDCANTNSKPYCEQYNKCKREFQKEITLIRSGPENYINNKEEYFKNLAPDDSWIAKALAIFQDSAAMSKNSPTIMSTLVSIILLVFSLYKVLKFFI